MTNYLNFKRKIIRLSFFLLTGTTLLSFIQQKLQHKDNHHNNLLSFILLIFIVYFYHCLKSILYIVILTQVYNSMTKRSFCVPRSLNRNFFEQFFCFFSINYILRKLEGKKMFSFKFKK